MHSIIRFISCPACLRRGIWEDIRVDIKERILSDTWRDNIHGENTLSERERRYLRLLRLRKTPDLLLVIQTDKFFEKYGHW